MFAVGAVPVWIARFVDELNVCVRQPHFGVIEQEFCKRSDCTFLETVVGGRPGHQLPGSSGETGIERLRQAFVGLTDEPQPFVFREAPDDLARIVGGSVVDHDEFQGVTLSEYGSDRIS